MKIPGLTVVVPIYNEADALPGFLGDLIEECAKNDWNAVLVNDGSTDGSSKLLEEYKTCYFVKIIDHKVNRGYGGALKSGISSTDTTHVVTIDGDGQHQIGDIKTVYQFALDNNADLVVGDRGRWKNASTYREFGKWIIRTFAGILMPLPIRDLNSGFKLYQTELAQKYISICPNSMAFSDVITLAFIHQRYLVLEHPITVIERRSGKSTIGSRTAMETILEIINLTMLFNPIKIFLPLSILCILVGIIWGIPFALMGNGVSVGAMLAIVLGGLFFALGLLASQLSSIRLDSLERSGSREEGS